MNENQKMWHECVPVEDDEIGIPIKKATEQKLRRLGHMFSTYSDVIEEILSHCDKCDQFVENRN